MSQPENSKNTNNRAINNTSLKLEGRGQRWLEKMVKAPHQEPWSITFLQFAWTAGPVTMIAAASAYYTAYGTTLPVERALYFLGYSLIAGLLGLAAKLVYNVTRGRKQQQAKRVMLETIDRLPELIHRVRDLQLENLSVDSRRTESAGMLLHRTDLSPSGLVSVIEDLTNDNELARKAEHIEMYRRAGLYNRMRDLVGETEAQTETACQLLRQTHPRIATSLQQRLQGRAPDPRDGRIREGLFLERILSAIEQDNDALMTLHDVEEMLALCFELICDRRIAYLKFEYNGRWHLARALDRLEEERNDYRISRARVYSRLKALAAFLNYRDAREDINAGTGLSSHALLNAITEAIDTLCRDINDNRRLMQNSHGTFFNRNMSALQLKTMQLKQALALYEEAHEAHIRLGRDQQDFSRALNRWQKHSLLDSRDSSHNYNESVKKGLIISEAEIHLTPEDRIELAQKVAPMMAGTRLYPGSESAPDGEKRLTVSRAKELAVEIALLLDPVIRLKDPQIQRAIDASPATSLATIEPGMTGKTKAALGESLSGAVHKNLAHSAERLAQNLIKYYRVPLGESTIDFLCDTYGANREKLEFIAEHEVPLGSRSPELNISNIRIPSVRNSWQITLYNATRQLSLAA